MGLDLVLVFVFGSFAAIPGCMAGRRRAALRVFLAIASAIFALYIVARLIPHGGGLWRLWPVALLGAGAMCGLSMLLDRRGSVPGVTSPP